MKSMLKKWIASSLVLSSLMVSALPATAATKTPTFGVLLSDYDAKAKSTIEFQVETEDKAVLFTGGTIKVQFPRQWGVPATIDETDVLLNGLKPKDVTFSNNIVTIVLPSGLDGKTEAIVEFTPDAGLTNPDKAGEYTFKAGVQANNKLLVSGKWKDRIESQTFTSDPVVIEGTSASNPSDSSTGTPNGSPLELPNGVDVSGATHKVIVRIGSTVGYYEKPSGMKLKPVSKKVGKLTYAPYVKNERTMIPFRFVAEGLGATIGYDDKTGVVGVSYGGDYMEFRAGSKTAVINGKPFEMDTATEIKDGQTMVPLRFAVEKMGAEVKWIQETETVLITK